jgi:hypothetical protein
MDSQEYEGGNTKRKVKRVIRGHTKWGIPKGIQLGHTELGITRRHTVGVYERSVYQGSYQEGILWGITRGIGHGAYRRRHTKAEYRKAIREAHKGTNLVGISRAYETVHSVDIPMGHTKRAYLGCIQSSVFQGTYQGGIPSGHTMCVYKVVYSKVHTKWAYHGHIPSSALQILYQGGHTE